MTRWCPGRSQPFSGAYNVPQEMQSPYIHFWRCTERHGTDPIAPSRTIIWREAVQRSERQCVPCALQMLQPLPLLLTHAGAFCPFQKLIPDPIHRLPPDLEHPPPPVHIILRT